MLDEQAYWKQAAWMVSHGFRVWDGGWGFIGGRVYEVNHKPRACVLPGYDVFDEQAYWKQAAWMVSYGFRVWDGGWG